MKAWSFALGMSTLLLIGLRATERCAPSPAAATVSASPQRRGTSSAIGSSRTFSSSTRASPWSKAGMSSTAGSATGATRALQRQIEFLRAAIADAAAFDSAQLSPAQVFERDYLVSVARRELFWLEDADQPHTNLTWYFDNGLDPDVYIARPYADAATRLRAFVAYARAVPAALAQIRANLRTPMPLSFVDYGVAGFNGFAEYYRGDVKTAFAAVEDPALQTELADAVETAAAAMTDAAAWLEAPARDGDAGLRARGRALCAHARADGRRDGVARRARGAWAAPISRAIRKPCARPAGSSRPAPRSANACSKWTPRSRRSAPWPKRAPSCRR